MGDSDRERLLNNEQSQSPPPYCAVNDDQQHNNLPPLCGNDELPPPYTPSVVTHTINCRVCQSPISLSGKQHLQVIKCDFCNEATPIRDAPPGKRFVRCSCNCLLICNAQATRIACPRQNCKRIILVQPVSHSTATVWQVRAFCGHCNSVMMVTAANADRRLIRCPTCTNTSVVNPAVKNKWGAIFLVIGLLFITAGVITTVTTLASGSSFYVVWIGAYVIGVLNIIRSCFWFSKKVSPRVSA